MAIFNAWFYFEIIGVMLFGSQELHDTANYTMLALDVVMNGVFTLAEHLNRKTQELTNTISNLDQEVNYISALSAQYQGTCVLLLSIVMYYLNFHVCLSSVCLPVCLFPFEP